MPFFKAVKSVRKLIKVKGFQELLPIAWGLKKFKVRNIPGKISPKFAIMHMNIIGIMSVKL